MTRGSRFQLFQRRFDDQTEPGVRSRSSRDAEVRRQAGSSVPTPLCPTYRQNLGAWKPLDLFH